MMSPIAQPSAPLGNQQPGHPLSEDSDRNLSLSVVAVFCGVKFWMVDWPCSRLHSCWLQQHTAFTVGGNIVHHFCRTFLSGAWLQTSFSSLHHSTGTYKVVFCNPFKNNSQLMGVVTSKNSEISVTKVIDLKSQRKWLENTLFFFPKRELEAGSCEPIWVVSGCPPLFCTVIPVIAMGGALLISSLYNVNMCADIYILLLQSPCTLYSCHYHGHKQTGTGQ